MQERILAALEAREGLTLSELGRAVGISRQLARYHVLKLTASGRLLTILTPCASNGGVQYRVWDKRALSQAEVLLSVAGALAA